MAKETLGPTEMAAHQSQAQTKLLKYALFAFAGLCVLLVGAAGGYWYEKNSNVKSQMSKPQPKTQNLTPTALPIISSTPTPDSTADWKIYRNSEYNFEFKYPANLSFGPLGAPVPLAFSLAGDSIAVTFSLYLMDVPSSYNWVVGHGPQGKTSIIYFPNAINIEEAKRGDYQTVEFEDVVPEEPRQKNVVFSKENYAYVFSLFRPSDESKEVFNQILSTFKFLDSTQNTSQNWETYQSEKIMDSFNTFKLFYPPSWKLTVNKKIPEPATLEPAALYVYLKKGDFVINIWQQPVSVVDCLYPEDPSREGAFSRHGNYKEIQKGKYLWRRAMLEPFSWGESARGIECYSVCEKEQTHGSNVFNGKTSIGFIGLVWPKGLAIDNQTLDEFDQILEKIEILD